VPKRRFADGELLTGNVIVAEQQDGRAAVSVTLGLPYDRPALDAPAVSSAWH
jgi:hypothetical protein